MTPNQALQATPGSAGRVVLRHWPGVPELALGHLAHCANNTQTPSLTHMKTSPAFLFSLVLIVYAGSLWYAVLSPNSAILFMSCVAAILALIAITAAFRMPSLANRSRVGSMFAALPALVMCGFFYSLAIHMHTVLGGWPGSIGERGFPSALATHGHIAWKYFTLLFLLSIFVWPIFFLLCFFIRRWRFCVYYLAVYAASFLVCFGSMLIAPPQFLNWWWD